MKKTLILIITLTFILSTLAGIAHAESWFCDNCKTYRNSEWCPDCGARRPTSQTGSWPEITLNGTGTSLRPFNDESKRHQSYFGPNSNYPGAGGYKPYKVISATALLQEGDFVLVDLNYKTVGRRCVYFKSSSLSNTGGNYITMTGHTVATITSVQPKFGPGYEYDDVVKKIQNNGQTTTESVVLGSGTWVNVFFETNGWVFAEFGSSLGTIRAWLPANTVR